MLASWNLVLVTGRRQRERSLFNDLVVCLLHELWIHEGFRVVQQKETKAKMKSLFVRALRSSVSFLKIGTPVIYGLICGKRTVHRMLNDRNGDQNIFRACTFLLIRTKSLKFFVLGFCRLRLGRQLWTKLNDMNMRKSYINNSYLHHSRRCKVCGIFCQPMQPLI